MMKNFVLRLYSSGKHPRVSLLHKVIVKKKLCDHFFLYLEYRGNVGFFNTVKVEWYILTVRPELVRLMNETHLSWK